MRVSLRLCLLAAFFCAMLGVTLWAHHDGAPAASTGGFGETSCASCHSDQAVNAPGGILEVKGIPQAYASGTDYPVTVALTADNLVRAGFEIAARFSDGPDKGKQAGTWKAENDRVQLIESDDKRLSYVENTLRGSNVQPRGTGTWTFDWIAPDSGTTAVTFSIAAVAGNNDESVSGDRVYVSTATSRGP